VDSVDSYLFMLLADSVFCRINVAFTYMIADVSTYHDFCLPCLFFWGDVRPMWPEGSPEGGCKDCWRIVR